MDSKTPAIPSAATRSGRRPWFRSGGVLLLLVVGSALALQGCFRHSWHDPERFERRAEWVTEEVAEELELREDQMPAFQALADKAKALARERMDLWRDNGDRARQALQASPADMETLAAMVKTRIRDTSMDERMAALVDETLAFYNSLDAGQQAIMIEHLDDKLDHFGH